MKNKKCLIYNILWFIFVSATSITMLSIAIFIDPIAGILSLLSNVFVAVSLLFRGLAWVEKRDDGQEGGTDV